MSTGDQSQYVRSKLAERGSTRGAKFMRDGFDMWAESETPAREGQMPKMASEPMEENYGGAMTVRHAKKLSKKLQGGSALSDAVDAAKKLLNFWRELSAWVDEFDADLQDEIIDHPTRPASVKEFAKDLRSKLAALKGAKAILDGVAALAGTVGLGKNELQGGMSLEEAGKHVQTILGWFKWFYNAYRNIEAIIGLPSFASVRPHIMKALSFIKGAVGLGKRCGCNGGAEEMISPGLTFEDVTPKGGRRRGAQIIMPRGTAPSDQHVSTMPYQYGGAVSTMPFEEDGADSYYSEGKPPRRKGGRKVGGMSCGGAQKMSVGQADAQKVAREGAMMAARMGSFNPSRKIGGAQKMSVGQADAQKAAHHGAMMAARMGSFNPSQKIGGRAPSARGAIVKKVMQEQGLSLPQASKYVKEHGLY